MEEKRKITPEERLWLINEVMNAEGFHGLLERIKNKINVNNLQNTNQSTNDSNIPQEIKNIDDKNVRGGTPVVTPDDKTYNYVEDSGMYEKDVLHLVAAEFGSNLDGKPLNVDVQVEASSNRIAPVEFSASSQTSKQEVIEGAITDNEEIAPEKPFIKVKEPEKNNPWASARTVVPGEIKLI